MLMYFVAFSSLSALERMVAICGQTGDNSEILFNSVVNVSVIKMYSQGVKVMMNIIRIIYINSHIYLKFVILYSGLSFKTAVYDLPL